MKRDPEFHQPLKIPGNPSYKNEGKYCDFHEQARHYTKGCITLRLLIEKLIKNGMLVQFLREQRNQLGNDKDNRLQNCRDYQPRDYYPQDRTQQDDRDRDNDPQDDIERRENRRSKSPRLRDTEFNHSNN
jgi:hypothetical protein